MSWIVLFQCKSCTAQMSVFVNTITDCPFCGGYISPIHPLAFSPRYDERIVQAYIRDLLDGVERRLQAEIEMDKVEALWYNEEKGILMAKKPTVIIEYRFDKSDGWTEYARTQVPSMVEHYVMLARVENPGAEVKKRDI